jgi:sterol desaturase/sphingolipid hydroxylase (fatty acid hydroxylase superfamily)
MTAFKERFQIGSGLLSGYIALFLAVLAVFGVLCFHFPELLTTPEFRNIYTGESMRALLIGDIILSVLLAATSIALNLKSKTALYALIFITISILIGGFQVNARDVAQTDLHLGLDWLLLDLLIMAIIFIPIEMIAPKRENQERFHPEWRTDLIYFIISHLLIQFFGVITQKPAVLFFGWMNLAPLQLYVQSLPYWIALPLALFVSDLFQYWAHRIFHSHTYLWRFHSVHHSTVTMDWLAGSRTHFIDIFVTRSLSFMPLYILGFSPLVFSSYIVIIALHAVFIHANTRMNLGFLKYLVTTPQYHHWHHCNDAEFYGKNFAVFFPIIDRIFGTHYLPNNVWPSGTGLLEADYPKGYVKQLVYPFTKSPFDNDLNMEEKSSR